VSFPSQFVEVLRGNRGRAGGKIPRPLADEIKIGFIGLSVRTAGFVNNFSVEMRYLARR
jgi:hypothetical protein